MKKHGPLRAGILAALLVIALIPVISPWAAANEKAALYLDGKLVYYCDDFKVEDGEIFLPLKESTLALGLDGWADARTRTVYLRHKLTLVIVDGDKKQARTGRDTAALAHAPIFAPTGVYVPAEVFTGPVASVLGQAIRVDGQGRGEDAAPAAPADAAAADFSTALRNAVDVIMIDPGHGGEDCGARCPSGTLEKDVTLIIANKLRDRLQREPGLTIHMTRQGDQRVALADRPKKAREKNADLFISIHANGYKTISAQGFETFFASLTATDQAANNLAILENQEGSTTDAAPGEVISDIDAILGDMAQTEWLMDSERLAVMIQQELARVLNSDNRGVKQAPFKVLMKATMPAVLIEVGFITSPTEARTITDPEMQDKIVDAIARAVLRFRDQTNARLGLGRPNP